jgi:tRNA dimethylallyltransferase
MDLIKLKEKIYSRLIKRLDNGMVEEVEDLHKNGLSWERMEEIGLEYRYIARYLQEQISKEEMIELLKNKIWQYAKNQIGWMKRY